MGIDKSGFGTVMVWLCEQTLVKVEKHHITSSLPRKRSELTIGIESGSSLISVLLKTTPHNLIIKQIFSEYCSYLGKFQICVQTN